jgi:enoyl-CoA hydratase/carnithine racemase
VVELRVEEHRATIEVPDFGPLTGYDAAFARDLGAAVIEASDDDRVKVLVLRSTGPDFAPGRQPAPLPSPAAILTGWHRDFAASAALYQALCFSKKVVLTEVAGECAGAGSMLVLCSDLTVAADDARFGSPFDLPEANFVLAALTMRLNRAKSWLLRGSVLPATQALAVGLVNRVVPATELAGATRAMVRAASGMPLDGITMSKMLLQAVLDGHGVGREFDMAGHYAIHRSTVAGPRSEGSR